MDFAVHFYIAKDKEGNMGFFKDVRDDIKAVLDRDPAARNGFEVLVCYPGIWSIIFHRPAHWLYGLEEWNDIFDEETRKKLYKEQKSSTTIVKEAKIYPNDPCPCGSGKKYKKCCGKNK